MIHFVQVLVVVRGLMNFPMEKINGLQVKIGKEQNVPVHLIRRENPLDVM